MEIWMRNVNRLYALKQMFIDGVTQLDGVQINGLTGRESAPHVISVSFRESGARFCYMHWRSGEFMFLREAPVLPISRERRHRLHCGQLVWIRS